MFMNTSDNIKKQFQHLGPEFMNELEEQAVFVKVQAKAELIKEGDHVRYVPFLVNGLVKVFTINNEGKELLYYFLRPNQVCIMTVSAIFRDSVSKVYAHADEDSEIMMFPVSTILAWIIKYPKINSIFYKEYEDKYLSMMEMVNQAVFHRLDKRILEYIAQKARMNHSDTVKISYKEIANNLGTAREVVSRLLKKFENEGVVIQNSQGIRIIDKK